MALSDEHGQCGIDGPPAYEQVVNEDRRQYFTVTAGAVSIKPVCFDPFVSFLRLQ